MTLLFMMPGDCGLTFLPKYLQTEKPVEKHKQNDVTLVPFNKYLYS